MMKPDYRELQQAYIVELREAMPVAQAWWLALVTRELGDSAAAAQAEAQRRWPDGAASHPQVIGVILKYMHACEAKNAGKERSEQVSANHFLIDGLDTRDSQDVNDFTDALTYWPISLDATGVRV
ncbi:MAG: hypothetical protein H7255_15810 [Ramlibacter sp.]|nr:hypothetical protein [Ramlibacter sp.]